MIRRGARHDRNPTMGVVPAADLVDRAQDTGIVLGAIIAALTLAIMILRRPWRAISNFVHFLGRLMEDWGGVPDRPGVPGRPGMMMMMQAHGEALEELRNDRANDRVEIRRHRRHLAALIQQVEWLMKRVPEQERWQPPKGDDLIL